MLACYPGATATAPNVNFFIVKYLLLRHNKFLQYSSKILLTKQFVACQLNQARIASSSSSFFIARFSVRVAGAVAQD